MSTYVEIHGIKVAKFLHDFIEREAITGTEVSSDAYWRGFAHVLTDFAPRNRALLLERDRLQAEIDVWCAERRGRGESPASPAEQTDFLTQIGYLAPRPESFRVATANVDPEVAQVAGPQLVVPLSNPRYVLNAANARWGSLYDALYGTDAIPFLDDAEKGSNYNVSRGARVVTRAKAALDVAAPLASGSHLNVTSYAVDGSRLVMALNDGSKTTLRDPSAFVGYRGATHAPDVILLRRHGLHLELSLDRAHPIGKSDPAGLADIILESAVTTIVDLEDSVAAVDAEDKVALYRNMLTLIRGELTATFEKGGRSVQRSLNPDRVYIAASGGALALPGRSLLFFRNVGHLMTTDAVLLDDGAQAPEGLVDGLVTALVASHDIRRLGSLVNSRAGSVYIVKPKMHGPAEVAFANDFFDAVEDVVAFPRHTLKIGVMDEERRTSTNLEACVAAVRNRIVFINTGFLDRTGDEIHTAMQAGPVIPKAEMKTAAWLQAYESGNVEIGLRTGLDACGQIGKGMWAMPDRMADMLIQKVAHPRAGASAAWVPSPTAATLHALHYHEVDVRSRQAELKGRSDIATGALLTLPIAVGRNYSNDEIKRELDNSCQSILGYVVRWIDQGVGCSKVPDIDDNGLMEDRATLRISSQMLANWLTHNVCSRDDVMDSLSRMAAVVDRQNASDPLYRPMAVDLKNCLAFQAACDLVFKGAAQPNGYTEPLLHAYRARAKLA